MCIYSNRPYHLSQLPRIYKIQNGQVVFFTEAIFTNNGNKNVYAGMREIVGEIEGLGTFENRVKIRVIKSEGVNALPANITIERPIANLYTGFDLSLQNGRFRDGGAVSSDEHMEKVGGYVVGLDSQGTVVADTDARKGGIGVGRKHSENGIKAKVNNTGQLIEFEGKEIILTAPVADNPRQYEFNGSKMTARQIASKLNTDNGGVSFAYGGELPKSCLCSGKTYKFGGKTMADYDILNTLNNCDCIHDLKAGYQAEKDEHYDTLSRLNQGEITIDQALYEIAQVHLDINPNYYKNHS